METDVLVLGSGIAGLDAGAQVAAESRDVLVLTKRGADDSSTNWAQGGIAAVFDRATASRAHVARHADVRRRALATRTWCGDGARGPGARRGAGRARACEFTREAAHGFDLGREGGHSRRRIVHAQRLRPAARSSRRCSSACARTRASALLEHQLAVDLILESRLRGRRRAAAGSDACWGAYVLDRRAAAHPRRSARAVTVLATGGCGKVYLYTTNPDVATGDGVAMAYRAGAAVANMEFVQFHPTCLYHPRGASPS